MYIVCIIDTIQPEGKQFMRKHG